MTDADDFTARIFARIDLDRYVSARSVLGEVYVAWNVLGVTAVRLAAGESAFEDWYAQRFARRCVPAVEDDAVSRAARARLRGEETDVPLDLRASSPFERSVLDRAARVKAGHARPYALIAREVGRPDAVRAVGRALGRNPIPLLVPCHRVIRTDCSIGGYVFGDDAKRALLESEGLDLGVLENVARRGYRYIQCDDGTFCLPTCGDVATRLDRPGYRGLHTLAETHGLEPCTSCRPLAA